MINLFEPRVDADTARVYLDDMLDRNEYSSLSGPLAKQLAKKVSQRMGFAYGVPCASGTVAAEALISVLSSGMDKPVIHTPYYNYMGISKMIVRMSRAWDAQVNFVSSNRVTYQANFDYSNYSSKASVYVRSYLYGNKHMYARMGTVIGDLCHLTGIDCTYQGLDHGFTSFYPTKNVCAGEGGLAMTNDPAVANELRDIVEGRCDVLASYNRRMSEANAALGLASLSDLDSRMLLRRRNYKYLADALSRWELNDLSDPYMFIIPMNNSRAYAERVCRNILKEGVEASLSYYDKPMQFPAGVQADISYDGTWLHDIGSVLKDHSVNSPQFGQQLALPCHEFLDEDDLDKIILAVKRADQ